MTQNEKKVVAEKWLFDGREKYFSEDVFVRFPCDYRKKPLDIG
jgi:hypothetical protein